MPCGCVRDPRYSDKAADLENAFVHLTNVAIQKKSDLCVRA